MPTNNMNLIPLGPGSFLLSDSLLDDDKLVEPRLPVFDNIGLQNIFFLQFRHSYVAPANFLQFISDMFHNSSDGSELLLSTIVSPVVCAVSEDSDVVHLVLVLVGDAVVTSVILPQQK